MLQPVFAAARRIRLLARDHLLPQHEPAYTAAEVLAALADPASLPGGRGRAILDTAAMPGAWTDYARLERLPVSFWLGGRLPSLVAWHSAGLGAEEMARRLGLAFTWDVERALELAGEAIARAATARRRAERGGRARDARPGRP